ncbi:helix-turn-helix domain-containing protein [Paenibacillus agaridevorans]|uniref:helix-turn-helix domain-containing protein n=1 Tax=Paenibacillus agaridevorans TaxID=171404 RepID=UPI001BE3F338|nr:AraC family transcriptional regulator [Paenibacillus agaridevorans]
MTVQRTIQHYMEHHFFGRHPDVYVQEAVENLWLSEHDHDFVELILVTGGRGTHYVDGVPLQAERGDLFAIPVGISHIFRPSASGSRSSRSSHGERLKVLNCLISKAALSRLSAFLGDDGIAEFLNWLSGNSYHDHGQDHDAKRRSWLRVRDDSDELRGLFTRLHAEYIGPAEPLSLWSGVLSLLAAVYRHADLVEDGEIAAPSAEAASRASSRPSAGVSVRKALAYMRAHYAEPLTVAVVARAAGIGERQLSRLFAAETGRPFRRHLEDIRVEACCRCLREGSVAIMDLPPLVGYEQWKSLSRVFRQAMGLSLGEYRKQAMLND